MIPTSLNRRLARSHNGQALVEFALVVPVFVLLLVGIFDVGRAVFAYSTLNNAAREAGRLEIVDQMCAEIKDKAVQHAVSLGVVASSVVVEVLQPDGSAYSPARVCPPNPAPGDSLMASIGDVAHVTVSYTYNAATPGISTLIGPILLKGETKFPIEASCVEPTQPSCPKGS